MPARKPKPRSKSRVAAVKKFKKSPRYKTTRLVIIALALALVGYFILRSFAATPAPPKNALADRFCGTWVLQQVDSTSQLSNLTADIKHGLDYNNMRGFSIRSNWKSVDNNGVFNPAIFDQGKALLAAYPGQSYSIRTIAGAKSPVRLFTMSDMYWYREDSDNNQSNGDNASGAQVPLPYNPNSATFAPNTGFEREYTKLVNDLVDYALANNIKLIHMPWYGRDWAELNYHYELWNEPNFSKDKWLQGHKRLADIVYNKVKDYPDLSVEFPLSGWNNLGEGPAATNELAGYLVDGSAHPLWANFSGRLFVQGNGYGVYSGLGAQSSTPTTRSIYRGMQMYDQMDKYSDKWAQMYDNLGKDPLYATYLEVYAGNFGYSATNQNNLQAGITNFHNSHCANAGGDSAAPQVSLTAPGNNSTVTDPTTITASASDDVGVTKVEFYADNALLGSKTAAPYTYSWNTTAITNGTHTLFAKAYDASGKSASSTIVTVTKPAPNQPPSLSIDSPSGGASFTEPATVNLNASASDSDGTVQKVEFYNGSTKLSESLSAPYQFSWSNVPAGNYTLSAKATDNQGSTAQSQPVGISVTKPPVATLNPPTSLGLGLSWDWSKWKNNMIASWKAPADLQNVTGYKINVYAYGNLIESTNLAGAGKTNYTIKNLIIGGRYKVQVFSRGASDTELSTPAEKSATYNCFGICWLAQ